MQDNDKKWTNLFIDVTAEEHHWQQWVT